MSGAVFPFERILLAFAELPQVEEVFQLALHLAAGPGRELFLLRVVPGGRERDEVPGEARVDEECLYSELRAINTLLQMEAIPAHLEAAPALGAESIVDYAEERQVDLIIAINQAVNGGAYRRLVEELLRQAPCTAMMLSGVPSEAEGQEPAGRERAGPVASLLVQGADAPAVAVNS